MEGFVRVALRRLLQDETLALIEGGGGPRRGAEALGVEGELPQRIPEGPDAIVVVEVDGHPDELGLGDAKVRAGGERVLLPLPARGPAASTPRGRPGVTGMESCDYAGFSVSLIVSPSWLAGVTFILSASGASGHFRVSCASASLKGL